MFDTESNALREGDVDLKCSYADRRWRSSGGPLDGRWGRAKAKPNGNGILRVAGWEIGSRLARLPRQEPRKRA